MLMAANERRLTLQCMLDMSTAFDFVGHSILLHRLQVGAEPAEGLPILPGRGPHVCSGASCWAGKNFLGAYRCMAVVVGGDH